MRIVIRWRAARSRLSRFVGGSIAAHVVLVAVALVLPMARHRPAPILDTMVVSLSGPIGGAASVAAAAGPATPAPAKAASAPPPKEAHSVRDVPVPKKQDKPDRTKKEPAKPPETPVPAAGHAQDAVASPAGGGAGAAGPGPGAASGSTGVTASVGGGDTTLGWYGAAVKAALESAWQKPFLEDQGQTYSVVIAFDIARDGTTRDVRIVQSSGVPSLDRSAQRAVIEASPLPAVPPSWKDDTLPATMRFDLNPEAQ